MEALSSLLSKLIFWASAVALLQTVLMKNSSPFYFRFKQEVVLKVLVIVCSKKEMLYTTHNHNLFEELWKEVEGEGCAEDYT